MTTIPHLEEVIAEVERYRKMFGKPILRIECGWRMLQALLTSPELRREPRDAPVLSSPDPFTHLIQGIPVVPGKYLGDWEWSLVFSGEK